MERALLAAMAEGSAAINAALRRVLRSNPGARLIVKHGANSVNALRGFENIPALEAPATIEVDAYIGAWSQRQCSVLGTRLFWLN